MNAQGVRRTQESGAAVEAGPRGGLVLRVRRKSGWRHPLPPIRGSRHASKVRGLMGTGGSGREASPLVPAQVPARANHGEGLCRSSGFFKEPL